jgi:hypothetical protein
MPKTHTKGRSCDGKGKYPTRQEAEDAMRAVIRKSGAHPAGMHTYPCDHCPNWHYGHRGRKRR